MSENKNANDEITLAKDQTESAITRIADLQSSTAFLAKLMQMGKVRKSDADVHLTLLRQCYDDLSAILGGSPLDSKLDEAYAQCRAANERARRLEKIAAGNVSTEAAAAHMRLAEKWFESWYALSGFHYAHTEWNPYGITAEFSSEVEHGDLDPCGGYRGDRELMVKTAHLVPYQFDERHGWDLSKDSFHDDLLDTDNNRRKAEKLFAEAFPGARINGFQSHREGDEYTLCVNVYLPWEAMAKWKNRLEALAEKHPTYRTGRFYSQRKELEHLLKNKDYVKHARPDDISSKRARLETLQVITDMWTNLVRLMYQDGKYTADGVQLKWRDHNEDRVLSFPAGTAYSEIAEKLSDAFSSDTFTLDVALDLSGADGLPDEPAVSGERSANDEN